MRKNRRDNKAKYLLILLLLIAVGYAAIATTLKINGTSTIKSARWNVYWENPQVLSGSVTNTAPTLSESDTKATFNVTLNEPGDYYEFTIDAVNNGSLDAKIDTNGIVKQVKNSSGQVVNPKILKYEVTNNDAGHTALEEGHILAKKSGSTPTKETYRVRVEYRNDEGINPSDLDDNDLVFTIEFSVKYVQGPKVVPSAITYVTRQNEGQITSGDVIRIGDTENFYVISTNSEKTVLLAKYNLLVGNEVENWSVTGQIASNTPGYGLQSDTATAYVDGTDGTFKGTIDFSQTNYWDDGNGNLVSPYNANGASYDGNPYPYVYDSNSTIYEYINGQSGYVNRLKSMGAPSTITGRLLTYEEADAVKEVGRVDIDEWTYTTIIFNGSSYWLGSVQLSDNFHVWSVESGFTNDNSGDYDFYSSNNYYMNSSSGVRPVIEIPTSELQ